MTDLLLILGAVLFIGLNAWLFWSRATPRQPLEVGAADLSVTLGGRISIFGNSYRGVFWVSDEVYERFSKDEIRVLAIREDAHYRRRFPWGPRFWGYVLLFLFYGTFPFVRFRFAPAPSLPELQVLVFLVFSLMLFHSLNAPSRPKELDRVALDRERDFALVARAILKYEQDRGVLL